MYTYMHYYVYIYIYMIDREAKQVKRKADGKS